jgi:HAD superfamily 5'-nucleotidase-like hydrolase
MSDQDAPSTDSRTDTSVAGANYGASAVSDPTDVEPERGIYCNRTLNLRSIDAIGYDMDYTLVHYNVDEWESRAYDHIKKRLMEAGWSVGELKFNSDDVMRGLVIDRELGNVVKANRFGYIKQAAHGTSMMDFGSMRDTYTRTLVELSDERWESLNTLFSISAATIYRQLVERLDRDELPNSVMSYDQLWERIQEALDAAHLEGVLKDEITSNPKRYIRRDPEMPKALLDQRQSGKKLLLITNSGWNYTRQILEFAMDPYLPEGMTWRDLFHVAVVAARKPDFFSGDKPMFKLANEDGLVRPVVGDLSEEGIYLGGNASMIEDFLGLSGDRILYVGDHIFSDVNVTKSVLRWRTALVVRELEDEIKAIDESQQRQDKIEELMDQKIQREKTYSALRLKKQRIQNDDARDNDVSDIQKRMNALRDEMIDIDRQIRPLVREDGRNFNPDWGYLMRAGNDKSMYTRQIERFADIYTSRVSNFLDYTPFVYFRAPRGSLPHDPRFRSVGPGDA